MGTRSVEGPGVLPGSWTWVEPIARALAPDGEEQEQAETAEGGTKRKG